MKKNSETFCQDLLGLDLKAVKGLISVLLSLGSEVTSKSPTELSKSDFFQYHYSIINKVTKELSEKLNLYDYGELDYTCKPSGNEFRQQLWQLIMKYLPKSRTYKTSSDFTTCRKPSSNSLAGRGYVQIPNNKIGGNQPIDIGYYYSYINVGLYDKGHPNPWSCPLDNIRVGLADDGLAVASKQLISLMNCADLPFQTAERVVNSSDSGYAQPSYIYPLLSQTANLNLIIRLRAGMKVYGFYKGEQKASGRTKVYADMPHYLQYDRERRYFNPTTKQYELKAQTPIFDLPTDDKFEFEVTTRKKRKLVVSLSRWNNLLLSGTREYTMSDYPFDLVSVEFIDKETGAWVFKRPMFLSFWGNNRSNYSLKDIYIDYKHRYDIEGHNRFSKQALLMDKYQTPEVSHLDAWIWIVQLTYLLLYTASDEVDVYINEWEKYLPQVKRALQSPAPKSVAITRKGTKALFSTFDLELYKPKSIKNGKGRKKGQKMPIRKYQRPQKKTEIKLSVEKIE